MKKILVSGCSHVFGQGFEDSPLGERPSKHAWPAFISKEFDCEIINLSQPGVGISSCIEKIQQYEPKNELSAIMIILPFSGRRLYRHIAQSGYETDVHYHHSGEFAQLGARWNKTIADFYRYCYNFRLDHVELISHMAYVRWLGNHFNIPVWVTTSTNVDIEYLNSQGIQLDTDQDWCSYCQLRKYDKLPDLHFGHAAHINFYKDHIRPWLLQHVFADK